ncbi:unnamed protein product [Phytophthora lilii]|uniref:Unnamed protein product n=1 Tax=Phytophthora lilii TaxID=2077276 RepID=A0A9W6XBR0_9STRA|nr:unnamed protein product [Phytophthora lilii]
MSKSRDYDCDQITSKPTKKAPKVIKGKQQPSIGDIYDMMGPDSPKETTSKSTSTKKYKYAHSKVIRTLT